MNVQQKKSRPKVITFVYIGVSVSESGLKDVKNRQIIQNFEGLIMESSKTYAEPLRS